MKKYRKPLCKRINLEGEPILGFDSATDKVGTAIPGGFAKKNNQLFDDDEEEGL